MSTQYHHYIGIDVGKSFHWLYATDAQGNTLLSTRINQNEHDLDTVFTRFAAAGPTLVVTDQPHNIGALTLACAHHSGCDTMFLPSLAMRRAAGILPGESKTDQKDAHVIALTARIMPTALRPVSHHHDRDELIALTGYDHDLHTDITRETNRLHALLAEVNPMFEAAVGNKITNTFFLKLLTRFGGPWGIRAAGKTKVRTWAARQTRVPQPLLNTCLDTAWAMTRQPGGTHTRETLTIPATAQRILDLSATRNTLLTTINTLLTNNPTYQALLTIPGVGPRTAATLITHINIDLFPTHNHLASYTGLAARTTQSGTSIKTHTAPRGGNKTVKNALYLSAFAAIRWDPKARDYYNTAKTAGKKHNTILISLARKRLKIMYAIMRDQTPYQA
jgi:hypothetical protein